MAIAEPRTFPAIPTGRYAAKVQDIELVESNFGKGEKDWRWTFDLGTVETLEGEDEETTLVYYTPGYITSKNKLGKALPAFGLAIDEAVDSADLIGLRVDVSVIETIRDDGSVGNRIEAVLPPRKRKAAPVETDDEPAPPKRAVTMAAVADDDEIPF